MWVAEIQDECILGLDFLELHGCMVDLGDNVLHIGGEAISLQKGSCSLAGLKSCCTVLDTNASLPSHSQSVASMNVAKLQPTETQWRMLNYRPDTTIAKCGHVF